MRKITNTSRFKKDLKKADKQNKDIGALTDVVNLLANDRNLDARMKDHDLSGNWSGFRECHIEPDWLLIYKKIEDPSELHLIRLGSHSELFK